MTPEVATKLAKLLRLLCDRSVDGETLAAANRLSAMVAAYGVDWDAALSGDSSPSEAAMSRVYREGYERGHADGARSAQPVGRDWTPTDGSNAEVGSDVDRLLGILKAAERSASA
jgi:hypothetical protein